MRNENLNKIANTSFRIKNQINFDTTLINYIIGERITRLEDLYNKLEDEGVTNYKEGQINKEARTKMGL